MLKAKNIPNTMGYSYSFNLSRFLDFQVKIMCDYRPVKDYLSSLSIVFLSVGLFFFGGTGG